MKLQQPFLGKGANSSDGSRQMGNNPSSVMMRDFYLGGK